jgi:hypothetical protein
VKRGARHASHDHPRTPTPRAKSKQWAEFRPTQNSLCEKSNPFVLSLEQLVLNKEDDFMWKPKQLLRPDVVDLLTQADFSPVKIEFLGWLSGNAAALNNSRNPVKAAHTLLAKDSNIAMIEKFFARKKQSVRPAETADHTEADEMFRRFSRWKDSQFPEEEVDNHDPAEEQI